MYEPAAARSRSFVTRFSNKPCFACHPQPGVEHFSFVTRRALDLTFLRAVGKTMEPGSRAPACRWADGQLLRRRARQPGVAPGVFPSPPGAAEVLRFPHQQ